MLEATRILSKQKVQNIRFVGLTLEELNPAFALKSRQMAQSLNLKDKKNNCTSLQVSQMMKKLFELQRKHWTTGKCASETLSSARMELETQMSQPEIAYVKQLEKIYEGISLTSWPGKTASMGSSFWVDEAVRAGRKVMGVLCLETVGCSSEREHSQRFPPGMKPEMFQANGVSSVDIGNFLAVIGDVNSGKLVISFSAQSAFDSVKLPRASLQVPLNYEQIARNMGDLLRSDHAPF